MNKKTGLLTAAVTLAATLLLVGLLYGLGQGAKAAVNEYYADYVGFAEKKDGEFSFIRSETVLAYSNELDMLYGTQYLEMLREEERLLYYALRYACEQGYARIFLPQTAQRVTAERASEIYHHLALDTPLIEQNMTIAVAEQSVEHRITVADFPIFSTRLEGADIEVVAFTDKAFEKKLKAVKAAQKIVADMPQGDTLAKARYLYKYVCENVQYIEYTTRGGARPDYIYDALIKGKSNCDGYAGSLSLLLTLAEVKNFELVRMQTEKERGHTWNVFVVGKKHYMLDGTVGCGNAVGFDGYGFALTEDMMGDYFLKKKLPRCTDESAAEYDVCIKEKKTDRQVADLLCKAWQQTGKNRLYIKISDGEKHDIDAIVQFFADGLQENMRLEYLTHKTEGFYLLYIKEK